LFAGVFERWEGASKARGREQFHREALEGKGEWRFERWEGTSKARGREQFHREALEGKGEWRFECWEGTSKARGREQFHREALEYRGVSSTVKLSVSKTELGGSNPSAPAS
jgi:hypothetical protein